VDYTRFEVHTSDHRPIGAHFTVTTKTVDEKASDAIVRQVEDQWEDHRQRVVREAYARWMIQRLGHVFLSDGGEGNPVYGKLDFRLIIFCPQY
jgi:NAD dependent epimerase/dehydratase family enzyme